MSLLNKTRIKKIGLDLVLYNTGVQGGKVVIGCLFVFTAFLAQVA